MVKSVESLMSNKIGIFAIVTILLVNVVFLSSVNSIAFAQTHDLISVKTSENSYQEGDTIVVSGNVETVIFDTPVTLQIFHEGNLVDIAQIKVAQDGKFTHTFQIEGPQWQKDGKYIVRATYGADAIIETGFQYNTKNSVTVTTDIFEVNAGSSGTFDVNYTIKGATVKDMITEKNLFALNVYLETEKDGSITLDLPRNYIDAKKSDNTDDAFIINIDGVEVPYQEISTNYNSRIIKIEFEQGDSDIEIFGTFVVSSTSSRKIDPQITISTDSSSYNIGDIIVISGKVKNPPDTEVSLMVSNPKNISIYHNVLNLQNDGTFSDMIIAGNNNQWIDGHYDITASITGKSSSISFNFNNYSSSEIVSISQDTVSQANPINQIDSKNNDQLDQLIEDNNKLREELERQGTEIDNLNKQVDFLSEIIKSIQSFFGSIFS